MFYKTVYCFVDENLQVFISKTNNVHRNTIDSDIDSTIDSTFDKTIDSTLVNSSIAKDSSIAKSSDIAQDSNIGSASKIDSASLVREDYKTEKILFRGSLAEAFIFAKKHFYKLELIFDYACGYLFAKSLPSSLDKSFDVKNRHGWEEYQTRELFTSDEFIHTSSYKNFTVWLTLGNVEPLIKKHKKQIATIKWQGYTLFQKICKQQSNLQDNAIILLEIDQKLICLGVIEGRVLACRVLEYRPFEYRPLEYRPLEYKTLDSTVMSDSANIHTSQQLLKEIEDTALYISKFNNNMDACFIYTSSDSTELTDIAAKLSKQQTWFKHEMLHYIPELSANAKLKDQLLTAHTASYKMYYLAGLFNICMLCCVYAYSKQFDQSALSTQHQQLLMRKQSLENEYNKYPTIYHIEKMQYYIDRYDAEKTLLKAISNLLHVSNGIIQNFVWKENKIYIEFCVRKPVHYMQFMQVSAQLKTLIAKYLGKFSVEISLAQDISVSNESNLASYKYEVHLQQEKDI